jgi:hypothetical protein
MSIDYKGLFWGMTMVPVTMGHLMTTWIAYPQQIAPSGCSKVGWLLIHVHCGKKEVVIDYGH